YTRRKRTIRLQTVPVDHKSRNICRTFSAFTLSAFSLCLFVALAPRAGLRFSAALHPVFLA
ncbi:MAG TPA: hypothetical protein VIM69_05080, partial [Opitutaceae bacterium]